MKLRMDNHFTILETNNALKKQTLLKYKYINNIHSI